MRDDCEMRVFEFVVRHLLYKIQMGNSDFGSSHDIGRAKYFGNGCMRGYDTFCGGGPVWQLYENSYKKEASFERIVLQLLHARWLRNLCIVGF